MSLDYLNIKIVGVVESQFNENAIIKPIGYLNKNWEFIELSHNEINEYFPTRGCIFAHKFLSHNPNLEDKCISIDVMPSNNDGRDKFVMNWKGVHPDEYGTVFKILDKNYLLGDPNIIFNSFQKADFTNIKNRTFKCYENKIFCIDENSIKDRVIKIWDYTKLIDKDKEDLLQTNDYKYYVLLKDNLETHCEYLDIMPDQELKDWMVNNFLIKEWANISEGTCNLQENLIKIVGKTKWPKCILGSRINRLLSMVDAITLTCDEIKKLMCHPKFEQLVIKSVEICSEDLVETVKCRCSDEINAIKEENEKTIKEKGEEVEIKIEALNEKYINIKAEYDKKIEDFKFNEEVNNKTLSLLEKSINEKANKIAELDERLSRLNKNKENILNEFGIVKDVIGLMVNSSEVGKGETTRISHNSNSCNIECFDEEDKPIKTCETFERRLGFYLKRNNRNTDLNKKLFGYLVHYKALLLPDIRIVYSIIQATGKCNYTVQYVTPDWKSFNDVWKNGLAEILKKCNENPDILNYYILQNINLTYIPCILQPIVDMAVGLVTKFPMTNIEYPSNLRIILTISKEEGLPLAEQSIRYFGCLKKDNYITDEAEEIYNSQEKCDFNGYISMKLIESLLFTPKPKTEYMSYIKKSDE